MNSEAQNTRLLLNGGLFLKFTVTHLCRATTVFL